LSTRRKARHAVRMSLQRWLAQAKETARPESPYLCDAFDAGELASVVPKFVPLGLWTYFNPFGPTIAALVAADVPGTDDWLLIHRVIHPFQPASWIRGWFPTEVAEDLQRLIEPLGQLFASNGFSEPPMFGTLPTNVVLVGQIIPPLAIRELFWHAALAAETRRLDRTCDLLERFKGDPMSRVQVEIDDVAARIEADAAEQTGESPLTREQFDRWWSLVTDPAHIASEVGALRGLDLGDLFGS